MDVSWAFVVLILYPALQVPAAWFVVEYFDLRNDDGPEPGGYSFHGDDGAERPAGRCDRCGADNDPEVTFCGDCLAPLGTAPR